MSRLLIKKSVIILTLACLILIWLIYKSSNFIEVQNERLEKIMDDDDDFDIPEHINFNESLMHRLMAVDNVNMNILKVIGPDLYGYNIITAHRLSLLREIPDTRPPECLNLLYDTNSMSPVSVIIPVYNEGYSVLMRTVYTIFHRTPGSLLKEVILIDDFSPYHDTKLALTKLRKKFKKLVVHRLKARSGLIKAKIQGELLATSEILVFMDSHTEVNIGWLPPLLQEILTDPLKKVVVPVIDTINADTFDYIKNPVTIGGFNWGLYFTWLPRHKIPENMIKSVKTPTLSGGYFAMTKTMYNNFGGYDKEMKSWGAENLEMSFRIWQCGGEIVLVPCSKVGHIFRTRRPHGESDSADNWLRNTLRMANVWMDDYIDRFFKIRPDGRTAVFGDISERKSLRDTLKCHSFKWYLEELLPDML